MNMEQVFDRAVAGFVFVVLVIFIFVMYQWIANGNNGFELYKHGLEPAYAYINEDGPWPGDIPKLDWHVMASPNGGESSWSFGKTAYASEEWCEAGRQALQTKADELGLVLVCQQQ